MADIRYPKNLNQEIMKAMNNAFEKTAVDPNLKGKIRKSGRGSYCPYSLSHEHAFEPYRKGRIKCVHCGKIKETKQPK